VNCDKTKETSAEILNHKKEQSFQFCNKKVIGGDDPSYLNFLAKLTLFVQKRQFSIDICSIVALIGSQLRALE